MGAPSSEVSYILATTGTGDHEAHKGHMVASEKKKKTLIFFLQIIETKNTD
jgi:hypothetical protein